jgi:branched-chain amino acid transport system permease protein
VLNTVINGLFVGGFYALVALGLSVVFGVLRLINLSHGELVVGGAYVASVLATDLGLGPFVVLPVALLVVGAISYVLQRHLLTGLLVNRPEGALVATFGLALLAQGLFTELFTSEPKALNSPLATSGVSVLGIDAPVMYVIGFVVGGVLCLATHLLLTRTRAGAVVRAAAADHATAGLVGIDVRRVYAITFGVSGAIAALAGVLMGVAFSFTPTTGTQYLLIGIAVVVLGGVGNVLGTFLAALFLGVIQALAAEVLGGGYQELAVYVTFFAVLVVRPQGLFARRALA